MKIEKEKKGNLLETGAPSRPLSGRLLSAAGRGLGMMFGLGGPARAAACVGGKGPESSG